VITNPGGSVIFVPTAEDAVEHYEGYK